MRMSRLVVVAVVGLAVSVAAGAQRGGARGGGGAGGFHGGGGGGFHGGVSSPAAGGSRGGFAQGGGARFSSGARVQGYRSGGPGAAYRGVVAGARPSFYERGRGYGDRDGRRWDRRDGFGYGVVGPLNYGWLDAGELGYGDDGWYPDDGSYGAIAANGPEEDPGADGQGYVDQGYAPGEYGPEQGGAQGGPTPEQAGQVASGQRAAPRLYDSDAVTLVFKDGRPAERIHNYALTRTTLYVTDGRHREIAVADLDLAATEKANRAAGVNFQLPQGQ